MTPQPHSDQRERIALALLNKHRADWDLVPVSTVDVCEDPDAYRGLADAVLDELASDETEVDR